MCGRVSHFAAYFELDKMKVLSHAHILEIERRNIMSCKKAIEMLQWMAGDTESVFFSYTNNKETRAMARLAVKAIKEHEKRLELIRLYRADNKKAVILGDLNIIESSRSAIAHLEMCEKTDCTK